MDVPGYLLRVACFPFRPLLRAIGPALHPAVVFSWWIAVPEQTSCSVTGSLRAGNTPKTAERECGRAAIKAVGQRARGDTGPLAVAVKVQACDDRKCLFPGRSSCQFREAGCRARKSAQRASH